MMTDIYVWEAFQSWTHFDPTDVVPTVAHPLEESVKSSAEALITREAVQRLEVSYQ